MNDINIPENPYLLLTPGPLSTSTPVKTAMLRDWCTWDDEYNALVTGIRRRLTGLASKADGYTAVLMQGSGTFSVEACLGTAVHDYGKVLVLTNGAYGKRMGNICERLRIDHITLDVGETGRPTASDVETALKDDDFISHVAVVHCETTTGMLNPIREIGKVVKQAGKTYIVDAMSSFGGIPMDMADMGADFLISSANKCIQGVPGFGFILARKTEMEKLEGLARSLSLDMYDQWREMEAKGGKWRFTSPTHTVRAFAAALEELEAEGGPEARHERYRASQRKLVKGMRHLGFTTLLPDEFHSPVITSFINPDHPDFTFVEFYTRLKSRGFVIYPGKVTDAKTFRIGNIGHVFPKDMDALLTAVEASMYWA